MREPICMFLGKRCPRKRTDSCVLRLREVLSEKLMGMSRRTVGKQHPSS